jgi:hypothetical protein
VTVLADSIVSVLWHLSPRIILVAVGTDEITMQDLHDTLTEREARPTNAIYPRLISSAGKENLGGGVSVGITSTLQNARLSFNANKLWAEAGTVTTGDATGRVLTDSAASFLTTAAPGNWVVNLDDGSICSVRTVDSDTQLTTDVLGSNFGASNQFTFGDRYRVLDIIQKSAVGGNLVGVDALQADLEPILGTAGTQVLKTASSSATLANQAALEHATFNGGVQVDVVNGSSGTVFPFGTALIPVNNMVDAAAIATSRGLGKFFVTGDLTLDDPSLVLDDKVFIGQSANLTTITIDTLADVDNCEFQTATVTGVLDGGTIARECVLLDASFINGFLFQTMLRGTVTLGGGAEANILDCFGAPGTDPIIDMGGSGQILNMENYNGDIRITNKSGADVVEIGIGSGHVTLEATVTNGAFDIKGVGELTDNSTGTTVNTAALINAAAITKAVWDESITTHTGTGTTGNAILLSKYQRGAIWIDPTNGAAGTQVGVNGTTSNPVTTLADAESLAASLGLRAFVIVTGSVTLTSNCTEWSFTGIAEATVNTAGFSVNESVFENVRLKGVMTGSVTIVRGAIEDVSGFLGTAHDCGIFGAISLAAGKSTFHSCFSQEPGTGTPEIDFVGAGRSINMRAYSGGIQLENMVDATNVATVELIAGQIIVDSSCTAGVAVLRGIGYLTDNSAGTTIDDDVLLAQMGRIR